MYNLTAKKHRTLNRATSLRQKNIARRNMQHLHSTKTLNSEPCNTCTAEKH
jgi:hypothetical protein